MAKTAKEKMKEYREKLKSDPERYQMYLEKARARKRKNYIPVEQLTKKQKVERRAKTKDYVRDHRIKKKIDQIRNAQDQVLEENATGTGPESGYDTQESAGPLIVNMPFPNRRNGPKKRTSNALAKKHREYNTLKTKFQDLEKKYKRNLKRFERYKKLNINIREEETPGELVTEEVSTPRSKTKLMMAKAGVNRSQKAEIKKQLLFANVFQTQVKTCRRGMTRSEIGALRGFIGGKILNKYRLAKTINKSTGLGRNRIARVATGMTHSQTSKRQREIARYRSRVEEFLLRDDNSRCNPGKQDKLKVNGENRQTRILTDYLKNLYSKFHGENPNSKLSLASFCRIRPPHIKLTRFISRSSCLCTKHQNVALCTQAMKKCGVSVPLNPEKFINDPANIENMTANTPEEITFGQWKRVAVEEKGRKKMIMKIVSSAMKKDEFLKHMDEQIKEFRDHVFRVHRQYQACQKIKQNLPKDDAIVIMDFAENYACKTLEEVQSAYWNQSSVTLHPVVIYFRDNIGDLQHQSLVIVSDEMGHNSVTVLSFLDHIVPEVKTCIPSIKKIHYFTDSPTSQYRNKTVFNLVANHERVFGCKAAWNYYEAGHGKGPCDGLGGTTKRMADDAVNTGKFTIQDACEFFKWTQSPSCSIKAVKFLYVSSTECQEKSKTLNMIDIKPIKGTMKLHIVVGLGNNQLLASTVSCYCDECISENKCNSNQWTSEVLIVSEKKPDENQPETTVHRSEDEPTEDRPAASESRPASEINVGDFVAARYDRNVYIGKVLECDDEDGEIEITFMENVRKLLQCPKHVDRLWVDRQEVLCTVEDPIPTGKSKRMFKLSQTDIDTVESKK